MKREEIQTQKSKIGNMKEAKEARIKNPGRISFLAHVPWVLCFWADMQASCIVQAVKRLLYSLYKVYTLCTNIPMPFSWLNSFAFLSVYKYSWKREILVCFL